MRSASYNGLAAASVGPVPPSPTLTAPVGAMNVTATATAATVEGVVSESHALLGPGDDDRASTHYEEPADGGASLEHHFLICCWRQPILKSAKIVCFLSVLSLASNLISLIWAGRQTALHIGIEVLALLVEAFCLLLLYYALTFRYAVYIRPYLVFNVMWNVVLVLLWFFCFIELFRGAHFPTRVSSSVWQALSATPRPSLTYYYYYRPDESLFPAISLLCGLGATILVNFWFLHIIILVYFSLQAQGKPRRSAPTTPAAWSAPTSPHYSTKPLVHL